VVNYRKCIIANGLAANNTRTNNLFNNLYKGFFAVPGPQSLSPKVDQPIKQSRLELGSSCKCCFKSRSKGKAAETVGLTSLRIIEDETNLENFISSENFNDYHMRQIYDKLS